MGYSHTLSWGRMGFLPREHHAPEAHRVQLEGRGGMMLERGENPFCRGTGPRITFSYSKADLWPGKTFQYMFFQPTCVEVGWNNLYWNPFSALPLVWWAGKTYAEIHSLPSLLWGGLEKLILKSILCPVHEDGRKERGAALSPFCMDQVNFLATSY